MGRAACGRRFLVVVVCLQLVATACRQVFNFLGPLWLPILADFLHLLVLVVGLFGASLRHFAYLSLYACWQVVWIGWSLFVMCLFLEVGILRRDNGILDLGTRIGSWWEMAGPGCRPIYALLPPDSSTPNGADPGESTDSSVLLPPMPLRVDGCILDPQYVEGLQAALQALMAAMGLVGAAVVLHSVRSLDSDRPKPHQQSLYSIQVSEVRDHRGSMRGVPHSTTPSPHPTGGDDDEEEEEGTASRPLTPRRVKRRSMRGSFVRAVGAVPQSAVAVRGSRRHTRNSIGAGGSYVNPVTRLLERGNGDSSTSTDSVAGRVPFVGRPGSARVVPHHGYPSRGHTNPLFQMAPETPRPASAHSAYSNFHGLRPLPHGQPLPWTASHPPPPSALSAETVI